MSCRPNRWIVRGPPAPSMEPRLHWQCDHPRHPAHRQLYDRRLRWVGVTDEGERNFDHGIGVRTGRGGAGTRAPADHTVLCGAQLHAATGDTAWTERGTHVREL